MWAYYRKTFVMTQTTIVLVSLALLLYWNVPWMGLLFFLIIMEAFVVAGAAWGERLRRKVLSAQSRLPVNRN